MGVLADIHASSAYRGLILWIIYFPIACSLVSAIWAGPIAAIEGARDDGGKAARGDDASCCDAAADDDDDGAFAELLASSEVAALLDGD